METQKNVAVAADNIFMPMPADRQNRIELSCERLRFIIRKQRVHQRRTDIVVELDGKSFYLGRP